MRLVDADILKEKFSRGIYNKHVCEVIDTQDTVDAEPVRRGKWIIKHRSHEFMRPSWCVCNQCGNAGDIGDNFCKHCGAKMEI